MPSASSTLEALLVNDPEHPAIRTFILLTKSILEAADSKKDLQSDLAALALIKGELAEMEKRLST
jgi:hypothetical protein